MTKQKVLSDDTIPIFVSGRPLAVFGPGVISSGFVSGLKVWLLLYNLTDELDRPNYSCKVPSSHLIL